MVRRATKKSATPEPTPAGAKTPRRAAATPTLLAGGNPQIAKGDGEAPVRDYIAAMPGWKRDAGRSLDAMIVGSVPGVRKAVRWNSPFYGVAGRGWFMSFHCMSGYVKVAFFQGASLQPLPPVASKQSGVRYFHVVEGEVLNEELVTSWIRQAAALPGAALF